MGPSTVCVTSLAGPGDDSAHSRQRGPGVECATRDRLRVGERTQQSNHRGVFCFYAENRNPRGQDSQASPARGTSSIPGLGTDPKAHMVCCMAKKKQTKQYWKVVTQKREWNFFGWYLGCFEKWKMEPNGIEVRLGFSQDHFTPDQADSLVL